MKPLIYFDFELIDDKNVKISKERLKEILEEVYVAGFEDGLDSKCYKSDTPIPRISPTFTCMGDH